MPICLLSDYIFLSLHLGIKYCSKVSFTLIWDIYFHVFEYVFCCFILFHILIFLKQSEHIILHIGTIDALFLTPENILKELKKLQDFILKFLPDVLPDFLNTSNKNREIKCKRKQQIIYQLSQKAKVWLYTLHKHHRGKCIWSHLSMTNGYDTKVFSKNLVSDAHAI